MQEPNSQWGSSQRENSKAVAWATYVERFFSPCKIAAHLLNTSTTHSFDTIKWRIIQNISGPDKYHYSKKSNLFCGEISRSVHKDGVPISHKLKFVLHQGRRTVTSESKSELVKLQKHQMLVLHCEF